MTCAFGSGVFLDCSFVHIFVTDVVVTDVVVTDVDAAVAVFCYQYANTLHDSC